MLPRERVATRRARVWRGVRTRAELQDCSGDNEHPPRGSWRPWRQEPFPRLQRQTIPAIRLATVLRELRGRLFASLPNHGCLSTSSLRLSDVASPSPCAGLVRAPNRLLTKYDQATWPR